MVISISNQISSSTVRLEGTCDNGEFTGTGFFYDFFIEGDGYVPCIVTNRHVFQVAKSISMLFTCTTSEGKDYYEKVNISDFPKAWIGHPNPQVDLGILPIAYIINLLKGKGVTPQYVSLRKENIPTKEQIDCLNAIEEIIMIGYPDGIWDEFNNKPIARKGITATYVKNDFCGRKEFLIDAACFPGSSGSPVFILNEGAYAIDGGISFGRRFYFLGVLYAGPQHVAQGNIVFSHDFKAITKIPNNLGLVIKAEELFAFEDELRKRL